MVLVYGSAYSFGVFFKPMLNEFGWTRAATSGPFSLNLIVSGLLGILAGRLSDRFGSRIVVTAGGVILGVGYLLVSGINSLWQFYLIYGVLLATGLSAMYIPLVSLIARRFTRRRGLMAGIGISGIGFGIGIVPSVASQMIINSSWRVSLLIMGAVNLVLITLLAQLLRGEAENSRPPDNVQVNPSIPAKEFTFREAVQTKVFWMIALAWFLYGFFFQVGLVHSVPYATDLGMTAIAAAGILTIIGIVGTFARVSLGFAGDRFGNKTTVVFSFGLLGIAYLGLVFSGKVEMLYVFAVIFGSLCGVGILIAPIVAEHYGFKALGTITGAIVFGNSLGGAIGPTLAGYIFDSNKSYSLAFVLCAIFGIIASLVIWMVKKKDQAYPSV
jgi:MFS family permease